MRFQNIKRTMACIAACGAFGLTVTTVNLAVAEEEWQRVSEPNLQPYTVVDGISIPKSFTGKPGNAQNGKKLFVHRKKGNCLTCHTAPIPEEDFHGKVAPDLSDVASRMTAGEMRLRIVNPKLINPDTPMMAYYRTHGLNQVKKGFAGKPMLNEQEVEDVVAYLMTLK